MNETTRERSLSVFEQIEDQLFKDLRASSCEGRLLSFVAESFLLYFAKYVMSEDLDMTDAEILHVFADWENSETLEHYCSTAVLNAVKAAEAGTFLYTIKGEFPDEE